MGDIEYLVVDTSDTRNSEIGIDITLMSYRSKRTLFSIGDFVNFTSWLNKKRFIKTL
jgi:hypothetical protein